MANYPVIFILDADNGFHIETNINNSQVSFSKAANWDQTAILNRSAPVITYANSGATDVSFTFDLYAVSDAKTEVIDPVNGLYSLVFPKEPGVKTPPVCKITCGHFFKEWLCVCQNVSVTFSQEGIWRGHSDGSSVAMPMSASVQVQFLEVDLYNRSAYQNGGGISLYPSRINSETDAFLGGWSYGGK